MEGGEIVGTLFFNKNVKKIMKIKKYGFQYTKILSK